MTIIAISGSASKNSSNTALLRAMQDRFQKNTHIEIYEGLRELPLFRPEDLELPLSSGVRDWKEMVKFAEAIIICTPEYTHNIPAVLKNGLEWITASGELADKKVLAMTFTPLEPRGEWAMRSLLSSLTTMNARVVAQVPLYKSDVDMVNGQIELSEEIADMLREAILLLK